MIDTNTGREVVKVIKIDACGTFGAINKAREQAKDLGLRIGSMCGDLPIALADVNEIFYVAKWTNIDSVDYIKMNGIIVSDDFREGSVEIKLFVESN